jgi:esterase/lipase superfamily enzyme
MKNILLIHGYGIGIKSSIFKNAEGDHAGFGAFSDLIKVGQAVVFRWDMPAALRFHEVFNVAHYLRIYKTEKEKATSKELQQILSEHMEKYQPSIIVCHSMGAYLFLEYIKKYNVPEQIEKIVFIQADIPYDFSIQNTVLGEKMKNGKIQVVNYYCPWDSTLVAARILHRYIPAGLVKVKNPLVHNKLFPLYSKINLHTCSINNKKFVEEIL